MTSVAARIVHSWLSLKTWVKLWLTFLNAVLLTALFFLDDPLGIYTLVSLPVTAVLLLAIAARHGGLVRLLGIGHLVPWLPLVVYAELRLATDWAGARIVPADDPALFAWALTLWAALVLCLVFDVYDVVRWLRGEHFVLGTEEAFRAGASKLSPALGAREPRCRTV